MLLRLGFGLAGLLGLTLAFAAAAPGTQSEMWVYIGTYTGKDSKGIYKLVLDPFTGKMSKPELVAETANPSFLAVHPNRKFLYAVGELNDVGGKKGGAVSAFTIDPKSGKLTLLNQQSSGGPGPCHISLDEEGKYALVANYSGGSACVLPIGPDGKLGEANDFVQHKGSSVNKSRQEGPHAHSINLDPDNRFAVVADLGLDQVLVYKFDATKGKLTPNDPPFFAVDPGAGPRHFAFHPLGKFAYVINELANTITAMRYNPQTGVLQKVQTVSTLPEDFKGKSYTAEVQVHPSGWYVYGSNRGHDSIVMFRVNEETGELKLIGHQSEGIKTPRNFGMDQQGKCLLVANQDGNSVISFRVDFQKGTLQPTGQSVEVPRPVCVKVTTSGEGG
jgi:6-phosphogluconolactonase